MYHHGVSQYELNGIRRRKIPVKIPMWGYEEDSRTPIHNISELDFLRSFAAGLDASVASSDDGCRHFIIVGHPYDEPSRAKVELYRQPNGFVGHLDVPDSSGVNPYVQKLSERLGVLQTHLI